MRTITLELNRLKVSLLPLSKTITRLNIHLKNNRANTDKLIIQRQEDIKNKRITNPTWLYLPQIIDKEINFAYKIFNLFSPTRDEKTIHDSLKISLEFIKKSNKEYSKNYKNFGEHLQKNDFESASFISKNLKTSEDELIYEVARLDKKLENTISHEVNDIFKNELNTTTLFLTISIVLIFLGVAIIVLSNITLTPLKKLTSAVKNISSGDFSQRLVIRSKDEVGELTGEFNKMAMSLEERDRKLLENNAKLVHAEKLAAIGAISSKITHEIRNPLNAIGLNVELLKDELLKKNLDIGKNIINTISNEIDRLAKISEEYLSYTRIRNVKLEKENPENILKELINLISEEAKIKNIKINYNAVNHNLELLLDSNKLKQAFLNILKNSLEAIGNNGAIEINTKLYNNNFEIEFKDSGCGIPENKEREIFNPFFSTKEKGTGLGLALTKQIITEHNGKIYCESTQGKGTKMVVILPR
jgi:signal transduction histidine kinase